MLRTLSADEKLREEYLAREKAITDHYASLKAAEKYGREEGIELGEKRGIKLGKEEERAENTRKLKTAMTTLLEQGVSIENIALAYQMTPEDVRHFLKD